MTLELLAGLGLVLGGLRLLADALDNGAGPSVTAREGAGFGAIAGAFAHSSAAPTVVAMSLLQRSRVSVEGALALALAGAIGAAVMPWIGTSGAIGRVGFTIVALVGIGAVVVRGHREVRQVALGVACGLLGWALLEPVVADGLALLDDLDGARFSGRLAAAGIGLVAALVVQSDALVVLGLAAAPFEPAVALSAVVGANLGATAPPLLIGRGLPRGRAVVGALTLVRAVVAAGLLLMVPAVASWWAPSAAGMHVLVNVVAALAWVPVLPLVARPTGEIPLPAALSAPVRRMLANVPEEAIEHVRRARDEALVELKIVHDEMLAAWAGEAPIPAGPSARLRARIAAAEELAVQIVARGGPADRCLTELHAIDGMIEDAAAFVGALATTRRSAKLAPLVEEARRRGEVAWAAALGAGRRAPYGPVVGLAACKDLPDDELLVASRQLARIERLWGRVEELASPAERASSTGVG